MDNFEFFTKYVLPDYFAKSILKRDGCVLKYFETAKNFQWKDGYRSTAIFGRIVYADRFGEEHKSESMAVKLMPDTGNKAIYSDMIFRNEIFVYSRIVPFYSTLNEAIFNIVPKYYYGSLTLADGENENASIVLENLSVRGYRAPKSRIFLDIDHLLLSVKKLAEFHAYSYYAKSAQPRVFHSMAKHLVETDQAVMRDRIGFCDRLNDHFTNSMMNDRRRGSKIRYIRRVLEDTDKFVENVLTRADEPTAVICHGDFLRNNLMFKYDSNRHPIDVKFIDLASARYCTPVVDLALILYMNADQETRDRYWDQLMDMYCTTLRDTFPTIEVPSKNRIMEEFKINSLYAYLIAAFFLPISFQVETDGKSLFEYFYFAYPEYRNHGWHDVPEDVKFKALRERWTLDQQRRVLDVLKDIIDRGFV